MKTIRCSSLPQLFACPASAHGDVSITSSHEAADAGTAAHEAMRSVVIGLDPDLDEIARRHAVDRDELGRLVWYARKCWRELSGSFPDPDTEVAYQAVVGGVRLTGHVDLRAYAGSEARILDYKTGRVDRDAYHQLAGYAALEMDANPDVQRVVFTVVWVRDEDVETYRFTRAQAETWAQDLAAIAGAADTYRTGSQCEFCQRSHECTALMAVARRDVSMFAAPDADTMLATATPAQLVEIRRRAKLVAKFADSVDDVIRKIVRQTGPLKAEDGAVLALVPEAGPRAVDTAAAWPVLQQYLTDDEIAGAVKVSIAKVLDAVGEKAPRGEKGRAKAAMSEALDAAGAISQTTVEKLKEIRKPRTETNQ